MYIRVCVCNPSSGNAFCMSRHRASANMLRYLHVHLVSIITERGPAERDANQGTETVTHQLLKNTLEIFLSSFRLELTDFVSEHASCFS